MNCRHCQGVLCNTSSWTSDLRPPPNAYLAADDLKAPEVQFPSQNCSSATIAGWCRQRTMHRRIQLFRADYAYFSSVSHTWLEHCARYVDHVTERFSLEWLEPRD